MPPIDNLSHQLSDTITIGDSALPPPYDEQLYGLLQALKPWRKGPFHLCSHHIDSEWQSFIKYNLLEPYLDITDKVVIDIGCNNGYYMFRASTKKPKRLIGFDPSPIFNMQFDLINAFLQQDMIYELLGVEHLLAYVKQEQLAVNVILCLGVLYHRKDPISTLKILYQSLVKGGVLLLDSFIIDGNDPIALCPEKTYSKITNVHFIPTLRTLKNWLIRAGFADITIIDVSITTIQEQRKTAWIDTQSLADFIDEQTGLSVEGYPRPTRAYIMAKKPT